MPALAEGTGGAQGWKNTAHSTQISWVMPWTYGHMTHWLAYDAQEHHAS